MQSDKTSFRERTVPFLQSIPDLLRYQITAAAVLGLLMAALSTLSQVLLRSAGRVAISSGDFVFLFTSWQGIVLLIFSLVTLFFYMALDLNIKVILSGKLIRKEEFTILGVIRESVVRLRHFLCLQGLGVIVFIALLAPILGVGLSISLTDRLYIPTFISSVIKSTPVYDILYKVAVVAFALLGLFHIFVLHGVLLDDMTVKDSMKQSRRMVIANWKNYLWRTALFFIKASLILLATALITMKFPVWLIEKASLSVYASRVCLLSSCLIGISVVGFIMLLITPMLIMMMTQLYDSYKSGTVIWYPVRDKRTHRIAAGCAVALIALCIVFSAAVSRSFDEVFPAESDVMVIAHRAGGTEGPENSVAGLKTASSLGAGGAEIDIQRTKDGHYVLNHDATFKRVAGVDRKPEDMTLEEIRQLSVDGEPVPTFGETLDASRDNLILFVELKGNTADEQMADDAVRMIKERNMEDQCVLISLKYELIEYIETKYPEMQTGFLTFISFGKTAELKCDYIGLEEESASNRVIQEIHYQGKKALVWTANEKESQKHFLCSGADGLITDEVSQAIGIRNGLPERSDVRRIIDALATL